MENTLSFHYSINRCDTERRKDQVDDPIKRSLHLSLAWNDYSAEETRITSWKTLLPYFLIYQAAALFTLCVAHSQKVLECRLKSEHLYLFTNPNSTAYPFEFGLNLLGLFEGKTYVAEAEVDSWNEYIEYWIPWTFIWSNNMKRVKKNANQSRGNRYVSD